MAESKDSFIRKKRRLGRSKAQAASDWKSSRRMKARKKSPTTKKKVAKKKVAKSSPAKRKKTAARKRNPAAGGGPVSVLLMNPYGGKKKVAKKRRRKASKKRKTTKRRRHRNPASGWDLAGVAISMVGGATVAGVTFLLDGTSVKLDYQNIGVGIGSAVAGVALSKHAPNIAKGVAATGFGVGVLGLLRSHVMPPLGQSRVTREKSEETAAVRARLGAQTRTLMMNAVKAQLGCQRGNSCDACADFKRCRMAELMNLKGLPAADGVGAVRAELPERRPAQPRRRREWNAAMTGMLGNVVGY